VVTFAAAAGSWERSPELRERLRSAAEKTTAPILLIQASNDYSTAPSKDLADELRRLHKSYVLKIYPPVGEQRTTDTTFCILRFHNGNMMSSDSLTNT
jgi:pimeloyl-ACP methyl ester carboxylesterase